MATKRSIPLGMPLAEAHEYFLAHLKYRRRSPHTIQNYDLSVRRFIAYVAAQGWDDDVTRITRQQVEAHLSDLQRTGQLKASSVGTRQAGLKSYFTYCTKELGLMERSPLAGMPTPKSPELERALVTEAECHALRRACRGTELQELRDAALLELLIATPLRRAELAGIRIQDLDTGERIVKVMGKGLHVRIVQFDAATNQALIRYKVARRSHPQATKYPDRFWLGPRGPLTGSGIAQILKERCRQAGIRPLHPHDFRHRFADAYLERGGEEGNLMTMAGWANANMIHRVYGRAGRVRRAKSAYDRLTGDGWA